MIDKKYFETVPCNICGSNSFSIVYPAQYNKEKDKDIVSKYRASGDELLIDQLVKCNKCGLVFINPRIKGNLIVDAYSQGSDETFVSQAPARVKTFLSSIKQIEKFSKPGKILDVGTAGGSFLAAAKSQGWDVYGCEPNRWLAAWGKKNYGIDIKPGTIFDQKYKKDSFDVVTLWDVIEHTPDPLSVLKECNRVLKNRGVLVVNYPDLASLVARLMGRKWLFLNSVHLYYFTPKTINLILRKAGFEIITIKPYFQKLEFGYLMFRASGVSQFISKVGMFFSKLFGLDKRLFPYWLGQTFVAVRKIKNT